mmetsp:Transcript_12861/g.36589  ORF Transcript_12861/g.36589 Transcript_12861/m.36589 type:complete len:283 (-) Transcript_12861:50-898(-)
MPSWRLATEDHLAASARASQSSSASLRSSIWSFASLSHSSRGSSLARSFRSLDSCASLLHCLRCWFQRLLRHRLSSAVRLVTSLSKAWSRLRASWTCVRSVEPVGPSALTTRDRLLGTGCCSGGGSGGGSSARRPCSSAADARTSVCMPASAHGGLCARETSASPAAAPALRGSWWCGPATLSRSRLTSASISTACFAALGGLSTFWNSALRMLRSAEPACSWAASAPPTPFGVGLAWPPRAASSVWPLFPARSAWRAALASSWEVFVLPFITNGLSATATT